MFDYHAIAPELILGVTLLGVIVVDLVLPDRLKYLAGVTALVGLVAAAFPLLTLAVCGDLQGCTDTGARSLLNRRHVAQSNRNPRANGDGYVENDILVVQQLLGILHADEVVVPLGLVDPESWIETDGAIGGGNEVLCDFFASKPANGAM